MLSEPMFRAFRAFAPCFPSPCFVLSNPSFRRAYANFLFAVAVSHSLPVRMFSSFGQMFLRVEKSTGTRKRKLPHASCRRQYHYTMRSRQSISPAIYAPLLLLRGGIPSSVVRTARSQSASKSSLVEKRIRNGREHLCSFLLLFPSLLRA